MCQPVLSAALTAAIELRYPDDATKNERSRPVPHPERPRDYFQATRDGMHNIKLCLRHFGWWFCRHRLSASHHLGPIEALRLLWTLARWLRPALQPIDAICEALDADAEPRPVEPQP